MSDPQQSIQKLLNYCDTLHNNNLPSGDWVEQERIGVKVQRRLSMLETFSALVESNFKCATHLRQSILQRALEGKLVR